MAVGSDRNLTFFQTADGEETRKQDQEDNDNLLHGNLDVLAVTTEEQKILQSKRRSRTQANMDRAALQIFSESQADTVKQPPSG